MTTPLLIIQVVFEYFGIGLDLMTDKTRKREKVQACQVAMYYIDKFTGQTHQTVAGYFGKDHSTFNHSVKTVNNMIDTDRRFREDINKIYSKLLASLGVNEFERYANFDTDNV